MGSFSLASLLDELAAQELVLGLFLVLAGGVFMVMGTRLSQAIIGISFGVVGFVIGGLLPVTPTMSLIYGFVGAGALATVSAWRPTFSVPVLAGAWAALCVVGLTTDMVPSEQLQLALAAVAAAIAVSLTFVVYRETLAMVTSFEGALLMLSGLVVFCSQNARFWRHIRELLLDTPIFAPFLVLAVTVTGFYLQLSEQRQKDSGMSA